MDMMNINEFFDEYAMRLYENSNRDAAPELKDLVSLEQYKALLQPVYELVKDGEFLSIDEARHYLFAQSGLTEKATKFILQGKMAPGAVFTYGTPIYRETVMLGNRQEVDYNDNHELVPAVEPMLENTIFDLASVTKLFTSTSIYMLVQSGQLELDQPITKYAPQFKNLSNVTVRDLLTFQVPLRTNGRIENADNAEDAENILFDIEVNPDFKFGMRPYTDMGAMVLKYVIEAVSHQPYMKFLNENIIEELGMKDTTLIVPKLKLSRTVNNNFDYQIKNGQLVLNTSVPKGVTYDPKARMLEARAGLSGHAGLKTTVEDMAVFARALMNKEILEQQYLDQLLKNATGQKYTVKNDNNEDEVKYIQYLGSLCYSKHPLEGSSEVCHTLSSKAFASAGFNGTQVTIDYVNKVYFAMGAGRVHNRYIMSDGSLRYTPVSTPENPNLIEVAGQEVINASKFAWDRDGAIVHPSIDLALQYACLEAVYQYYAPEVLEQGCSEKMYRF